MSGEPETGNVRLKYETMKRFCKKVGSVDNARSVIDKKKLGLNV
jgi:hypothetical protein